MIYLDNSATTFPSEGVIAAMEQALRECAGNPSSVHAAGLKAKKLLDESRRDVLSLLGEKNPDPASLIFTGSGTEADNLAVRGVLKAKNFRFTPRVITTDSEHPAISHILNRMEETEGVEVVRLSTKGGVIDGKEFSEALNERTVLVTMMYVNNETGAVYDIASAFSEVKSRFPECVTHTDAVQAFGKIPVIPKKLKADLVTVSGHKIRGPKGIGALYINPTLIRQKKLIPEILGGGQENGFRSGTENMPGIAGLAEACREIAGKGYRDDRAAELRSFLLSKLDPRVRVNTPAGAFLPQLVSLTLPGIKSEVMLRHLSAKDICVSSGSACSSHRRTASGTLLAFGLSERDADCTLRVSFTPDNTEEELSALADALRAGLDSLARIR
ncbi:MAG: cysteine desulfurase [Lachnospiraceae bacterium]|nr:cysteine desulfurase [Lachnospiraceae bacterium]